MKQYLDDHGMQNTLEKYDEKHISVHICVASNQRLEFSIKIILYILHNFA